MPEILAAAAGESLLASEVVGSTAATLTAEQLAAQEAARQAAIQAAEEAARQAATQTAAQQAAQAAAEDAARQAAQQTITNGVADTTTQEAIRNQLVQNAGSQGLPTVAQSLTTGAADPLTQEAIRNQLIQNAGPSGLPSIAQAAAPATPVNPAGIEQLGNYTFDSAKIPSVEGFKPMPTSPAVNSPYSFQPTYGNYQFTDPSKIVPPSPAPQGNIIDKGLDWIKDNKLTAGLGALSASQYMNRSLTPTPEKYKGSLSKFHFNPDVYQPYEPEPPKPLYAPQYASYAAGGLSNLGGYSDGGRMLKGPGDGMSDNIPATIANKQPARLANEEFVIPADVVSHLGNGSSEAGAKQLYKMMDRVRQARTGTKKQGRQINPDKYLA